MLLSFCFPVCDIRITIFVGVVMRVKVTTGQVSGIADILETAGLCTLLQIFVLFLYIFDLLCTPLVLFLLQGQRKRNSVQRRIKPQAQLTMSMTKANGYQHNEHIYFGRMKFNQNFIVQWYYCLPNWSRREAMKTNSVMSKKAFPGLGWILASSAVVNLGDFSSFWQVWSGILIVPETSEAQSWNCRGTGCILSGWP